MPNTEVTIKGATDKELDSLIVRLRKENEASDLVSSLKRKSTPVDPLNPYGYREVTVSTEEPVKDLYHYGTPGMRWGIRSKNKSLVIQKKYEEGSEDHKKRMDLRGKSIHTMSNAELKTLNERMNLERQYKDLSKMDISPGKKFVTELLANAGKETAKNLLSKYMTKIAEGGIDKIISSTKKAAKKAT